MVSSTIHVDIRRPLAEVYAYLVEPRNYPLWQSGLLSMKGTVGMPVGSHIHAESVHMGQKLDLRAVVTVNDGEREFCAQSTHGPVTFQTRYTLDPLPDGTRVGITSQIDAHVVFRLAEPLLQSMSDMKFEGDLQNLKLLLEAGTYKAH